jgi:4-hydroxy-3-polyprenylbenzoate decarboxylase
MEVSCITKKKNPTFLATVVGKPPLEDKYMGWATERIFLPLLKTTAPDLIDYHMPESGAFHNLILAKMKPLYKRHAKQFMHAFWGAGQMSFVKHAIFFNQNAPELTNYESLMIYMLDRFSPKSLFISEGILDALDHSSPESLVGGKLGIDVTSAKMPVDKPILLESEVLLEKLKVLIEDVVDVEQYMRMTRNPITVISVNKRKNVKEYFDALLPLSNHLRIVIFVDKEKNDISNPYMLVWRVANNIDAQRDIFISGLTVGIDGTNKNSLDGYTREWPGDVECTKEVVERLKEKGVWDLSDEEYKKYQL